MFSSPEWSTGAPFVFSCFVVFLIQVMSLQVVASKSRMGSLQTHSQIRGFSCDLSGVSRLALLRRQGAIHRHFVYEQFASESCDGIGRNNMKRKKQVIVSLLVLYKCILG